MFQSVKNSLFSIFVLFFLTISYAQTASVEYTLLSSNANESIIRVDFPSYQTIPVNVNGTTMYRIEMKDAYPILEVGSPELLKTAISLIVPENSHPTVEIISSDYTMRDHFELVPSKGRLLRNVDPSTVSYVKGSSFFQDRFLKDNLVSAGETYQLHDYNGVAIQFYPFAYNPVQKSLKVYSSITVCVRYNSSHSFKHVNKISKTFDAIYSDHFLNYSSAKSTPLEEEGDILILAPYNFCEAMQPYAQWKIKNGYATEIVSLDVVGNNTTAIKNYITNYYNNHNLVYVILVGDYNQMPTPTVGGNVSDNYYAEIVGNDNYPDVIIGKISAENIDQVESQVSKFIQYEQNPTQNTHFPVYMGIGSNEGPGDNNEYDWQHIRNINTQLANYTYTSGYEFFEGSHGGLDASGNPTANSIAEAVNAGVGIINYCGHGSDNSWVTSNFSSPNITNLTNYGKLPFIISVACVNGNYKGQTCFAEAWLRAYKNNQPTGAVGTLMSTINQPWNSPMCTQDHIANILTGNNTSQKRTFGGICFNGIIKMLDNYNDYEVARTWILFGDPALMVRTTVPQTLNINYEQELTYGSPSTTIISSVEGARVVLSKGNDVLVKSTISGGSATLNIPSSVEVYDTLSLLVSAPNYIPAEGNIFVIPNDGPFVLCQDMFLHDNRNNDGAADYGETVIVDALMKNIGNVAANNINMHVTTSDPYVTMLSTDFNINTITAGNTHTSNSAFSFRVAQDAPAFHNAVFEITVSFDNITRHFSKSIELHAPIYKTGSLTIDDNENGNHNGRFDLHESAFIKIPVTNNGNGAANAGMVYVSNPDGALEIFRYPQELPALAVGESYTLKIRANTRTNNPTSAQIHLRFVTNDGYSYTQDLYLKVGFVIEDWEGGNFSAFNWNNNSGMPWTITTQNPYEGTYAVRSGAINHNGSTSLQITNTNTADDTLSFYYKVSSEEGYDFLQFFIDNTLIESWSGNIGWTKYSMIVPAGTHSFKWTYMKDYYMSSGQDMAMLDNISFPCMSQSTGMEDHSIVSLSITPNPTTDNFHVLFPNIENFNKPKYQLFDITGRILQQEYITNIRTTISLTGYTSGLYLLKIYDGQNTLETLKIVKE